ncbi:MAG: hypothetical protein JO255_15180 [Alphaproteobacteria bacterium]|nr:hypothetical protein [Alphaproteobacteria bacterium]
MAMRMNARTGVPGSTHSSPAHVVIVYHKGSGAVLETHGFSDAAAPDPALVEQRRRQSLHRFLFRATLPRHEVGAVSVEAEALPRRTAIRVDPPTGRLILR